MTAVDRIRDEIAHAEYGAHAGTTVELWTEEAEALCDLADVCREHQALVDKFVAEQRSADEMTEAEAEQVADLTARERAALARLDGEDGQ